MNISRIYLIIMKDLREFSRDRLWMILSPLSLLMFAGLIHLLPENPVEIISVGVFPASYSNFSSVSDFAGGEIVGFESREALSISVLEGDELLLGVAFSDSGSSVELFLSSSATHVQRRAAESAMRELSIALSALALGENPLDGLPVRTPHLQNLFAGNEAISLRDKFKPLLFVVVLLVEALAIAGLISVEIENRTATALIATTATIWDLLLAKIITGILLGSIQVLLFLVITGGLSSSLWALAVIIFLGAWMASSVGMISGAAGRDFMGTLFLGLALIVPLLVPALALLFSGTPGGFLRLIPSYGLVMSVSSVFNRGSNVVEIAPFLVELLMWNSILTYVGMYVLKRKVESL